MVSNVINQFVSNNNSNYSPYHSVQVVAGQTAALALKKIKRTAVRKGMVLVDEKLRPHACWEFNAEIAVLTHSTTIQPRYQVCSEPCFVFDLCCAICRG